MLDFDRDTTLKQLRPGRYRGELSRRWWVGRGPNGGFLAALALRASTLELNDPARPPRSLTLHYLSSSHEGQLDVGVTVERSGSRVSNCLVRLDQDGQPIALGLAVFATGSENGRSFDHTRFPDAPPPDALEAIPDHVDGLPEFMRNFEYRFALGHLPFSGAPEPTSGVWIRTPAPRRPDPIVLAAFSDAWAPTPYTQLDGPAGAPTLELTIQFRDHTWYGSAADDAFVLGVFRSRLLADGLFEEDGELWSNDGILLAQSRQLAMLVE